MAKNFSFFLAKRYMIPKGLFLVIINLLTILGVCLGVSVMIVVLSVMKGFENEFRRILLGFDPHILALDLSGPRGDPRAPTYGEVGEKLENVPGVIDQSPFVSGPVLVQVGNRVQTPIMKAIRPDDQQLKELQESGMVEAGELDLEPRVDENDNIYERVIVSRALADSFPGPDGLPLQIGDVMTVISPIMVERLLAEVRDYRELPEEKQRQHCADFLDSLEQAMIPQELVVTAVVNSPEHQPVIITSLMVGQELFGFEETDQVHGLALYLDEPYQAGQIKRRILDGHLLPFNWDVLTWVDQNKLRLDAIRMERSLMSVILFIIVIVAAFCVTVTIIVTTVQKRREIGVLKAIGAQTGQIVRVFVHQAQIVGLCGVLSGVALGLIFLHQLETIRAFIGKFGADPFSQQIYGLSKLPIEIIPGSITGIAIGALLACTLAAIPPAWAVARLDAAKALRAD